MTLTRLPITLLIIAALVLPACVPREENQLADSYDMTGQWQFQMQVEDYVTTGAMSVALDGAAYSGTLTTNRGDNVLPVQSLVLQGEDIVMTVKSPQGNVVFRGTLDPATDTFSGKVTYHNGQVFPMQGKRQLPAMPEN